MDGAFPPTELPREPVTAEAASPATFCECHHYATDHVDGTGECDAWIGTGPTASVCRCKRFTVQP